MTKSTVAIVRTPEYDCNQIYEALKNGVRLIGGLEGLIKPGSRVFVKINHLPPASPAERGIVTHPVFTEAVVRLLKETGASVTIGDDIDTETQDGFEVSGYRQMAERAGVKLLNLKEAGFVKTAANGQRLAEVYLSKAVLEADVIVNLPKLKTHSLTVFTGGIKNMYGIIPNGLRKRLHGEHMKREDFSQAVVDIFALARPQLTIMDAIIAMEGEGPASGRLRKLGIILYSRDAVALDTVATRIIGLEPGDVLTTRYAAERGLGTGDLKDIAIFGERLEDVTAPGFRLPRGAANALAGRIPRALSRGMTDRLTVKPGVDIRRCTGCQACQDACPAGAIEVSNGKAHLDSAKCIRCMCCHEVCRYEAIALRGQALASGLSSMMNRWQRLTNRK